jgi:putative transcriptional regulator
LTGVFEDPLYSILRSKREVSRLQILVEIAEHQPAVRQQEIAQKLGVTPQAVSEYIRELVDDGMVAAHGRGRYGVTREGIEWVLNHAEALESYARHIRRDIIQQVSTWTALAAEDLGEGDTVGVYMREGLLYASKEPRSARVGDTDAGWKVSVARLSGSSLSERNSCLPGAPDSAGNSRMVKGTSDRVVSKAGFVAQRWCVVLRRCG